MLPILPQAVINLIKEVAGATVMFQSDIIKLFTEDVYHQALKNKLVTERPSPMGTVIFLTTMGRTIAEVAGAYIPSERSALNAAYLKRVELLIKEKFDITPSREERRHSLTYTLKGRRVLALARATGYVNRVIRKIYADNINTGNFHTLHVFYYNLNNEKIAYYRKTFFQPQENTETLDESRLRLFNVDEEAQGFVNINSRRRKTPTIY